MWKLGEVGTKSTNGSWRTSFGEPGTNFDALPQTGQLPVEIFYGVGGLITAAGVFLKKRK